MLPIDEHLITLNRISVLINLHFEERLLLRGGLVTRDDPEYPFLTELMKDEFQVNFISIQKIPPALFMAAASWIFASHFTQLEIFLSRNDDL